MQIIKLSFFIFIIKKKTLGFQISLNLGCKKKKKKLNSVQAYKSRPKTSMLQVENTKLATLSKT